MREVTGIGGVLNGSGARAQVARPVSVHGGAPGRVGEVRRRSSGPGPVRPAAPLALVRPAQATRPVCAAVPVRAGQPRVLVRSSVGVVPVERVRRVLAGLAAFVVTVAVVVGLGLLASAASAQRGAEAPPEMPPSVVVTVDRAGTVWDVARSMAPAADGPAVAALVERIVTLNDLGSVAVTPGQVLRVPVG